jgi:hypothetical protein
MKSPVPNTLAVRRVQSNFRQCAVIVYAQTVVVTHADISGILPSPHYQHSFNTDPFPCYQSYTVRVTKLLVDCVLFNRFCNRLYQTFCASLRRQQEWDTDCYYKERLLKNKNQIGQQIHRVENLLTLTNFRWHSAAFRCLSIEQGFLLTRKALNTKPVLSHASGSAQHQRPIQDKDKKNRVTSLYQHRSGILLV